MSFSEKVLSPENLTQGESRYEEINGKRNGNQELPADGEKVGLIQQVADNNDDNEQEKPLDGGGKKVPRYDHQGVNDKIAKNTIAENRAKEDDHPTPEEILAQFQNSALGESRKAEGGDRNQIA